MEKKICSKCKEEKEVCDFYKCPKKDGEVRTKCKLCMNEYSFKYSLNNKENIKKIKQHYIDNNQQKVKQSKKEWFIKNPKYQKEWCLNNYQTDIIYRLKSIIRARLRIFIKSKNTTKNNSTFDIVGCTPEFLKEHIEKQFKEGMSWELMGKYIHIDHIIPLASAKTEEEIYKLCHYTNLQPLWAEDNLKKGDKLLTFLS
jgi:hypothetical protein